MKSKKFATEIVENVFLTVKIEHFVSGKSHRITSATITVYDFLRRMIAEKHVFYKHKMVGNVLLGEKVTLSLKISNTETVNVV